MIRRLRVHSLAVAITSAVMGAAATTAEPALSNDTRFTIEWQRTLWDRRGSLRAESATRMRDGSIAVIGRFNNRQTGKTVGFVALYSAAGKATKIKLFSHAGRSRCRHAAAMPDGGVVMLCATNMGTERRRAALLYVNPVTGRIWSRKLWINEARLGAVRYTYPVWIATNKRGGIFLGISQISQTGTNAYVAVSGLPQAYQQNTVRPAWRSVKSAFRMQAVGSMPTGERIILGLLNQPGQRFDRYSFFVTTNRRGVWSRGQVALARAEPRSTYTSLIPLAGQGPLVVGAVNRNRQFAGVVSQYSADHKRRVFHQTYPFPGRGGAFMSVNRLSPGRLLVTGSLTPKQGSNLSFALMVWDVNARRFVQRHLIDTDRNDVATGSVRLGPNRFLLFGTMTGGGKDAAVRLVVYRTAKAVAQGSGQEGGQEGGRPDGQRGGGDDGRKKTDDGLGRLGLDEDGSAKPGRKKQADGDGSGRDRSGGERAAAVQALKPVWTRAYYEGKNELLSALTVANGKIYVRGARYFDTKKGRTLTTLSLTGDRLNRTLWPGVVGYDCAGPVAYGGGVALACPPEGPDDKKAETVIRLFDKDGKPVRDIKLSAPGEGFRRSAPQSFLATDAGGLALSMVWSGGGKRIHSLVTVDAAGAVKARTVSDKPVIDLGAYQGMARRFGAVSLNAFSRYRLAYDTKTYKTFYASGDIQIRRLDLAAGQRTALAVYKADGRALRMSAALPLSADALVIAGAAMQPVSAGQIPSPSLPDARRKKLMPKQPESAFLVRLRLQGDQASPAWQKTAEDLKRETGFIAVTAIVRLSGGRIAIFGREPGSPSAFGMAVLREVDGGVLQRFRFTGTTLRGVVSGVQLPDGALIVGGGKDVARLELPK